MSFQDQLKEKRIAAGFTQSQLAQKAAVTVRTIQNYELGSRRPANMEIVNRLAQALCVTPQDLLGSAERYVIAAQEQGGAAAARDIQALVGEVTGLFAGGHLSDEALDGAMRALNEAYWIAKENNKKYAPKKRRKTDR